MTVHRFQPRDSLSYVQERALETFSLSYADQSIITGYVGKDIVQIGQYYALTRFGCALDCNDPHFNGVDGILGLGMPDAALPQIPTPLLFAVSNDRGGIEGANYINEHPLRRRKFAFLSTAEGAELQLGGYDRASTNADMVYVPTTSTTEYSVNVQSLTFGGIELLDWVDKSRPNALPAIMDTGTTCLVIPDTLLGGRVSEKPFSKFKAIMTKGISFYITIDGHLFEIPYEFWWQKINQAPCVQPTPSSYAGLLLGDVVFQSLVVEFDLTKPSRPQVGVAPRNPLYSPVPPGVHDELKLPVIKKAGRHSPEVLEPDQERDDSHMVDHVPVAMSRLRTEYYVNISVGSPRQAFTVLIDTGSSTLAVFAKMPPEHSNLAISGSLEVKLHRAREELLHKDAAQRAVQRGQELELKERRAREAEERRERLEDLQGLGEGAGSAAAAFEISKSTSSRKEAMSLQFLRSGSGGTGASLYLMGSEEDRREEEGGAWGREWLLAGLGVALMVVGVGLAARRRLREGSKEPERTEMGMVT